MALLLLLVAMITLYQVVLIHVPSSSSSSSSSYCFVSSFSNNYNSRNNHQNMYSPMTTPFSATRNPIPSALKKTKTTSTTTAITTTTQLFTWSSSSIILSSSSASGIDTLPQWVQALVFIGTYLGLGIGTTIGVQILDNISKNSIGLEQWRNIIIDSDNTVNHPILSLSKILGGLYIVAGIRHFQNFHDYEQIYPPKGTWGLWYVPGSSSFHVAWTGILEILGGTGLVVSSYANSDDDNNDEQVSSLGLKFMQPISAFILCVLTMIVTPANIYMFTHGVTLGGGTSSSLDCWQYHSIRFFVQILLLSVLLILAKDSFVYTWADELD